MTPANTAGPQPFLRNAWYAAAWDSEVGETPLARQMLGEPVVLFRDGEGQVAALVDRCPHRLTPLSMGDLVGGNIRCGYHGMQFDRTGNCTHIPGQSLIPPGARVGAYPLILRYGLIWLWMGDAALADPALLPQVRRHGDDGWAVVDGGYQLHQANYKIIVENLMDPAHTTFVHKNTIANPAAEEAAVKVERDGTTIRAFRWLENSQPSPFDKQSRDFGDAQVDRCQSFSFTPPGTSFVDICTMTAGLPKEDAAMDTGIRNHSYKFLTPETGASTHIFWLHVRNHRVGDVPWEERFRSNLDTTFWEDNVIASAVQIEQERTGVSQYVALAIDKAPVMALRQIDQMIAREAG
jgi:phenylpropionate dioxygenase-like ring-hydroxylating dioxygenase large terminal subunit